MSYPKSYKKIRDNGEGIKIQCERFDGFGFGIFSEGQKQKGLGCVAELVTDETAKEIAEFILESLGER